MVKRGSFLRLRADAVMKQVAAEYVSGVPASEIADRIGCSVWSVYKALRRAGVKRQNPTAHVDPNLVRNMYESGKTLAEVAEAFHCTPSAIYSLMRRARIPRRGRGRPAGRVTSPERDQAMAGLRDQGATLQEIGDVFGLTRERVRQVLNSMGYSTDPYQVRDRRKKRMNGERAQVSPESLKYLIHEEKLSVAEVSKRVGRSISVVRRWMTKMRIEAPEKRLRSS